MISHVPVCLLAHGEKGLISNTFCYAKREYSLSVKFPMAVLPLFGLSPTKSHAHVGYLPQHQAPLGAQYLGGLQVPVNSRIAARSTTAMIAAPFSR